MPPRKSRSRKTAEKMAKYKESLNQQSRFASQCEKTRKSPRNNKSKRHSDSSTLCSPQKSTESAEESNRATSTKIQGLDSRTNRLESATLIPETPPPEENVVPETPPRDMQVAGRKRALAPKALSFHGARSQEGTDEDSQMPSKKRRSFNTPPRPEQGSASKTDDRDGDREDPTLLPQTNHMDVPTTNLFDEFFDSPPLSFETRRHRQKQRELEGNQKRQSWALGGARNGGPPRLGRLSPLPQDRDLEFISASSEALRRQLDAFKKIFVEEIRGLHRVQLTELRNMNDQMKREVMSQVSNFQGVIELISGRFKVSSTGKANSKTSLNAWEEKLNELTPSADVIFSKEVFSRILCVNAPLKVVEVYSKLNETDTNRACMAVQSLLFSLQPGDKKKNFSSAIGRFHSEMKYAAVQNAFFNVCRDTFGLFIQTSAPQNETHLDKGSHSSVVTGKSKRIIRPDWIQEGYVTVQHINAARKFIEQPNQSRKGKIRETPSPDDIANHRALRVYRKLTSHLHTGRDYVRTAFFHRLGYLFVPWIDHVDDTDQSSMSLVLSDEEKDSFLSLEDVPYTELCSFSADSQKSHQADAANKKLLSDLFSEWPSMVLEARHEVYVVTGSGSQRKHSGGEKRVIHRLINLIEVACSVVAEYTRVGSVELFLRSHKTALQCIMVFAFLFRELIVEFVSLRMELEYIPKPERVCVSVTSLKDLIPGPTTQTSYLKSRCLRVTEKEFAVLHQQGYPDEDTSQRIDKDSLDSTNITESAEIGIGCI